LWASNQQIVLPRNGLHLHERTLGLLESYGILDKRHLPTRPGQVSRFQSQGGKTATNPHGYPFDPGSELPTYALGKASFSERIGAAPCSFPFGSICCNCNHDHAVRGHAVWQEFPYESLSKIACSKGSVLEVLDGRIEV
jgi:hypothetical protein